jgi:hypothetical protein
VAATGGGEGLALLRWLGSMAAAVMYGEAEERIHLGSHVTGNPIVRGAQNVTFRYLADRFPGQFS